MDTWNATDFTPVRNIPFRQVFESLAIQEGMIPEESGITVSAAVQMADAITRAYRYAWQFHDWPESFDLQPTAVKLHPTAGVPFVPRSLPTVTHATVARFWNADPDFDETAQEIDHRQTRDGYALPGCALATVWVESRPDAPRFDATEYDVGTLYLAGRVVYDADPARLGHCYKALVNSQGVSLDNAAQWQPLPILALLESATLAGAAALMSTTEKQYGTAQLLDGAMVSILEQEVIRLATQQGRTHSYKR